MTDALAEIIADLPRGVLVREVRVCLHWTVVLSRRCGMASTLYGDHPHGEPDVSGAGRLTEQEAHSLALLTQSDSLVEASIGMAALNSLLEPDLSRCVELNAAEVIMAHGAGRNVVIVGHFPFVEKVREVVGKLSVLELKPAAGDLHASQACGVIPEADVVAITGTTLINRTFNDLIALCPPRALVLVLGPSTPLSPVLFDYGVDIIAGAYVEEPEVLLRYVSEGASFKQAQGVRLLTMRK